MKCPYCHSVDNKVVDSRLSESDSVIRRRRECLLCKKRFTTFERFEDKQLYVIKRNGGKEQFDREKILSGLRRACEKRDILPDQIEIVADQIEEHFREKPGIEIPSKDIGLIVLIRLRELDDVAYIRFASVYKNFQDASQFGAEAAKLEKLSPPKGEKS